ATRLPLPVPQTGFPAPWDAINLVPTTSRLRLFALGLMRITADLSALAGCSDIPSILLNLIIGPLSSTLKDAEPYGTLVD
ncbi:MAG: hypothetical protein ACJ8CB_07720, partial [Ktedonobacteraceae bacterium]